jgi:glycerate kinase
MRVLVAPDKFRGTLTARQAAEAIETGWRRARPGDDLDLLPMADGGEGTLEALVAAEGGITRMIRVCSPLGDPTDAPLGLVESGGRRLAIVESATASGLALLSESRRDPSRATSMGTGDLIKAALDADAGRVLVCLGGSAVNDGGTGMATALGIRFLNDEGIDLPPGAAGLIRLARIDVSGLDLRLHRAQVVGATDVDNVLTGPSGASFVFAPQKGASPEDVLLLDRALGHLAAIVHRDLGISPKDEPGAGAAGGLGFGLLAFFGARLRPGVQVVMDAVDFDARLTGADLVITGEGLLDEQSLHGKVPAGVLRAAELHGVPVVIVCGSARVELPGATVVSLVDSVGKDAAMQDARTSVETVARALAERVPELVPGAK